MHFTLMAMASNRASDRLGLVKKGKLIIKEGKVREARNALTLPPKFF
jgi:hypothetical protein